MDCFRVIYCPQYFPKPIYCLLTHQLKETISSSEVENLFLCKRNKTCPILFSIMSPGSSTKAYFADYKCHLYIDVKR